MVSRCLVIHFLSLFHVMWNRTLVFTDTTDANLHFLLASSGSKRNWRNSASNARLPASHWCIVVIAARTFLRRTSHQTWEEQVLTTLISDFNEGTFEKMSQSCMRHQVSKQLTLTRRFPQPQHKNEAWSVTATSLGTAWTTNYMYFKSGFWTLLYFILWLLHEARGTLVPQGSSQRPCTGSAALSHWINQEVPKHFFGSTTWTMHGV